MKIGTDNYKKLLNSGFTLVEVSIVIVIVGLLVTSVFAGNALIKSAQLQNVIKEIRENDTAIKQFKEKFKYYPGDLPNATSYWPSATNGNGNWAIQTPATEALYVWQDLVFAGLIQGSYSGTISSPTYVQSVNVPGSTYPNGVFFFLYHTNNFQTTGNTLTFSKISADGSDAWDKSIITSTDAYSIDTKMDDGNAGTGNLYAIDGGDTTSGSCSGSFSGAPANFNLTSNAISCRLFWWLDKNK